MQASQSSKSSAVIPLRRVQTPEDIGQAAVFLCQADNITGEAIVVAGGMVMD